MVDEASNAEMSDEYYAEIRREATIQRYGQKFYDYLMTWGTEGSGTMNNFTQLIRGELKGISTCFITRKEQEVVLQWGTRSYTEGYLAGETWLYLRGGPTGFESIQVSEETRDIVGEYGWHACAGTSERWDELYIPAGEMKRVFDLILGVEEQREV